MAIKRFSDGSSIKNTFKLSRGATSVAKPTEPTIGTATQTGATTATVEFTASSLGATATSFAATSSPSGGTGSGSSSPLSITGLTSATSYTFSVTASNANGSSLSSGQSNSVTTVNTATGFEAIETYTFATNTLNTVTFSSIPQYYNHLFIIYQAAGTINDGTRIRFNGDTSTNAYFGSNQVNGSSTSVSTSVGSYSSTGISDIFSLLGNSYGASQSSAGIAYINDYSKTGKYKTITGNVSNLNTSDEGGVMTSTGAWLGSTAAINSITIVARTQNFDTGSTITIYGIA
jgi:hypothetical protein